MEHILKFNYEPLKFIEKICQDILYKAETLLFPTVKESTVYHILVKYSRLRHLCGYFCTVRYSFSSQTSTSALNFVINQPPINGSCSISSSNVMRSVAGSKSRSWFARLTLTLYMLKDYAMLKLPEDWPLRKVETIVVVILLHNTHP